MVHTLNRSTTKDDLETDELVMAKWYTEGN